MTPDAAALRRAARQEQFLDVVSRDEAEARFRRHLRMEPLGEETVPLAAARGRLLTSREVGMLAAVGLAAVPVWRRPRVAVFSTGNEIVAPGQPIRPGQVFDSNATILAAAVEEAGGEPVPLGIVPDDPAALQARLDQALAAGDMVLLSGGTSKGVGDLAYQVVARLADPGVVVHGVALKPGKPLCLAVHGGKPVVVLPGFPISAIFTFHEFAAPVIRPFAGLPALRPEVVDATLPLRIGSERGRTEYVMASLMQAPGGGLLAYPTAKGSGAVTGFAQADGFFAVPALTEAVPVGTAVRMQLIGTVAAAADLVVIGSHCVGLAAARRGECDVAGVHLMDPATGEYNRPFLTDALRLAPGYGRLQGVVFRPDDARFQGLADAGAVMRVEGALMVNRNAGSGTRILIDRVLGGARPPGYSAQTKSHNAVAVAQGRADWGVAIQTVTAEYGLSFLPLQAEQYDFVTPAARLDRAPVQRFLEVLRRPSTQAALRARGFELADG